MKNFGYLDLDKGADNKFKDYVCIDGGKLLIGEELGGIADGYVVVNYLGPYAGGTEREMNGMIEDNVKSYLLENGIVKKVDETMDGFPLYTY